jgi:rhodanese-related sulfurtransferase
VAQQFMKAGYSKLFALKGGWNAWEKGKYPTEPK